MKRKYLNTLLAVAVLGMSWFAFTYWDKYRSHETTASESKPEEKLVSLDSSHIQAFRLEPRDGPAFTCRRQGGKWVLEGPPKSPSSPLPADPSTVSSFLNSLTTATVEEVVDPHPASVKDFGLDPPAERVEVSTDTKPPQLTLSLGDETPTSNGLYAQVSGNPRLVTMPAYLKSSLEKSLFDLRDKRALTLDVDQVQRISVESKGKRWTIEKNPEGVWDLVLPPLVRADRSSVDGLVSALRGLSMQTIVAEDKKKFVQYGFGSPTLKVELASPQGAQSLLLGKKDGERYDAVNSALAPIFTLNSTILTQFQKDPTDLRDRDLFSFSTFDAKRVEVDTPKGHWAFEQNKDNKWKETAPKAKDITVDNMDGLLSNIRNLRAASFPKGADLSALGLTKPAYRFQVQFGDKNQTETVEASKVGEHTYARRTADPLPSELAKNALDAVDKALGSL
jgi:hypothetical protein